VKILKSKCEKIWLFDVEIDDISIKAGLACFLSQCSAFALFPFQGKEIEACLPLSAINSGVPLRITNARLFLQQGKS
jgi:hypothetical protein